MKAGILCLTLVAVTVVLFWLNRAPLRASGAVEGAKTGPVKVMVFDGNGKLVGPVEMARVVKTEEEWKKQLTAQEYEISRQDGTERPFSSPLLNNKEEGVYSCVACGLPLFESGAKFESGTGWPSYFKSIGEGNVAETEDGSLGMRRVAISCGRCDGHLGHVFEDGPKPTGRRYCVDGFVLKFTPTGQLASLADPVVAGMKPGEAPATQPAGK